MNSCGQRVHRSSCREEPGRRGHSDSNSKVFPRNTIHSATGWQAPASNTSLWDEADVSERPPRHTAARHRALDFQAGSGWGPFKWASLVCVRLEGALPMHFATMFLYLSRRSGGPCVSGG